MKPTRRAPLAAMIVCLLFAATLRAQNPEPNLRVVGVGGLLGYMDGFVRPEKPAEAWGGLFGVERWLKKPGNRLEGDLLLVTGNNFSLASTNTGLAALKADAVALSFDDFLRSLRPKDQAGAFVFRLADPTGPPFVVSNAIVRIHQKHLNIVKSGGLKLEVPEGESVGWVNTITVSCRHCPPSLVATITETTAGGPAMVATATTASDGRHITVTFEPYLRPERRYHLLLTRVGESAPAGDFTFITHVPLTRLPAGSASNPVPPALRDLPIRYFTRTLEDQVRDKQDPPKLVVNPVQAQVVVVGMVDPGVKALLGAKNWRWKSSAQGPDCPGDECEIDFVPPAAALSAIESRLKAAAPSTPPVFVLLSGLSDDQTLALVKGSTRVPIVLHDPDADTLGGNGDEAILNHETPKATQVWVRPPWIGAKADVVTGRMTWDRDENVWLMQAPGANAKDIEGEKIAPKVDAAARKVEYFLGNTSTGMSLGAPSDLYPTYPQVVAPPAGALWVTREGTAALLLDVMRRKLGADIALLPTNFVDEDVVKWLAAEAKLKPLDWLSRFTLEKTLYKMEDVVTIDVEGSKLADTIEAMIKSEDGKDQQLFAAGLAASGALATLDKTHLRVNDRPIVATHVYKIALPQSVAEPQKLQLATGTIPSMLEAIDQRMRNETAARLAVSPLGAQLDQQFSQRTSVYFNVTPGHFEVHRATVKDPDKAFATIPLAGRAVQEEKQWAAATTADLGIDWTKVALRGTFDGKYAKKTIGDVSTNPNDEWTVGPRGDYKVERGGLDRLFLGYFRETWFQHHVEKAITPSMDRTDLADLAGRPVAKATVTGAGVSPRIEKPSYRYWRAGADLQSRTVGPWVTLKNVTAAFDFRGQAFKDRTDVVVSGMTRPIGEYFMSPAALVNSVFAQRPDLFGSAQELTFLYSPTPRDQQRVQFNGSIEIKPTAKWTRDLKLTTTTIYREYLQKDTRPDFTANWTLDFQAKFEWTAYNRLKMGPFVNIYRVDAKGASGLFKYTDWGIGLDLPLFIGFHPARAVQ